MKLIVIVLCLLSERFLIHSLSHRRFFWFNDYYSFIKKTVSAQLPTSPWYLLGAIVIPLALVTAFIFLLLHKVLFGFLGFIFSLVLFYYCLGPCNAFYPLTDGDPKADNIKLVGKYLANINSQLFAVIFWYIIFGPIAALAYRLIFLSKDISDVSKQASQLCNVLEWLPARITVLSYLLAGNFQRGISPFRQFVLSRPEANEKMLGECGLEALYSNEASEVSMPIAESLVEHATIVLLVFIALFTLAAWL